MWWVQQELINGALSQAFSPWEILMRKHICSGHYEKPLAKTLKLITVYTHSCQNMSKQQSLRKWHERVLLSTSRLCWICLTGPFNKISSHGGVLVSTCRADLGWPARRYEMGWDTKSWHSRSPFLLFPGSHCNVPRAAGGNCRNSELADACSCFSSAIFYCP